MSLESTILRQREKRWLNLCVANLRILIGFAFLPAGLKKLLYQPFTDPEKLGIFHEFLHAFYATGPFYQLVGIIQLLGAVLLMTQRYALVGATLLMPILVAITALCWSSAGIPTTVVVTLMSAGTLALLLWDLPRWRGIFVESNRPLRIDFVPPESPIDDRLWQLCGSAILLVYLLATAVHGGVYRPRGAELDNPAFYLLPLIALFPVLTLLIEALRRRRS